LIDVDDDVDVDVDVGLGWVGIEKRTTGNERMKAI